MAKTWTQDERDKAILKYMHNGLSYLEAIQKVEEDIREEEIEELRRLDEEEEIERMLFNEDAYEEEIGWG